MRGLPIDVLIPEVLRELHDGRNLVIEAPPGAGKTTRIPPALTSILPGQVLVLEPRRLAARMAARRVSDEQNERLGTSTGYQVRFETVGSPATRLWYLTEGVLTRRLISDRELKGVSAVVLDEFHERHLDGDFALAMLRRLQQTTRADLRIVVMSATLASAPVAGFLGGCRILRSEGRLHSISVRYTPHSAEPLESQVAGALKKLLSEGLDGDVLVFLPGAAEIRKAARTCAAIAAAAALEVHPLHGDLSPEEQDRAVLPSAVRKVILSTNVAESSITIEGVAAVIDSGLARVAADSPWSGLPSLEVTRVSKASSNQRAGRAGRTRAGTVIRLFSEEDFVRRREQDSPEIIRRELSRVSLEARVFGAASVAQLPWLDEPPASAVKAADELLARLGALDAQSRLTEMGKHMAQLPLHPRLARLVLAADARGVGEDGCAVAALLSGRERLPAHSRNVSGRSDLLALLDAEWTPGTRKLVEQIRREVRPRRQAASDEKELLISILEAFPDRVARRRRGEDLLLAGGGSALLEPQSVVRKQEFMVAVDIEERRERGLPLVRLASGIEPDWLIDLFPDRVSERRTVEWNREAERAEGSSALLYDGLVIEESRSEAEPEEASRQLARKALEAGVSRFADREELDAFLGRVAFAAGHGPVRRLGEDDVLHAMEELCTGLKSFRELAEVSGSGGLLRALRARLSAGQIRLLDEIAPEWIRLTERRRVKVNYSSEKPPWIASRLQDFFGMRETPTVARGKVPLVLHLLAPNQRPVQTTTDLAGFWERLYPQVRRELSRRYPKHAWPEKPLTSGLRSHARRVDG